MLGELPLGRFEDALACVHHRQSSSSAPLRSNKCFKHVIDRPKSRCRAASSPLSLMKTTKERFSMDGLATTRFSQPASPHQLDAVAQALEANGIRAHRTASFANTCELVLRLIPAGSAIMDFPSVTLAQTGVLSAATESGRYEMLRRRLDGLHGEERMQTMRRLAATPQVAIGSCNALTEQGELLFASALGSQLGAYAHGASKVVLVVRAQKLVSDMDEGLE